LSKRQQIVEAVKARLATIRTTNEYADGKNYKTDIGKKLTEWNPGPKDEDELPGIDIRDELERTVIGESKNSGVYERQLEITVIAEVKEPNPTAEVARNALEDLIHAVGVDPQWGGLARRTLPDEDEITVDSLGQRVGAARLKFKVEYSRKPWEA